MQKIIKFLRSMKFGMVLLVCVLLLSLAGSLIPQGNDPAWYAQNYPQFHQIILTLGLHRLFSTWYFVTLMALLCTSLTLCSLTRIGSVRRQASGLAETAGKLPAAVPLPEEQREILNAYLKKARYQRTEAGGAAVWIKNRLGCYGSFLTHLGILLVFVVGGAVLCFSDVRDYTILPGETLTLEDGTRVEVEEFHIEDETGRLDYASRLTITAPDGTVDRGAEVKVNAPHSFRGRKYYQQTYGTCGSVTVRDGQGGEDTFTLNEVCFLSADGITGVWYEALYPGYIQAEDGSVTLITSTSGAYADPVYQILVCGEEGQTPVLAFPGEKVTVGELTFTFNEPVSYPGIRVKTLPRAVTALLYAAFVLLLAGLWLCFFHVPVAVVVREDGYALSGTRDMGTALELASLLGEAYAPLSKKENSPPLAAEDAGSKEE